MTRTASRTYKPRRDNGLRVTLLFTNGYEVWGWWCPACSRPDVHIGHDGYKTRDGARREAQKHEKRRGH